MGLNLYLHIPFCEAKCGFCFYASVAGASAAAREEYLEALARELSARAARPGRRLATIYVGGGTPSLLTVGEWERLVAALSDRFDLDRAAEFTVECNPTSLDAAKLDAFAAAGVDRLSLGVQSLDDGLLSRFGRRGTEGRLGQVLDLARARGLSNINCDVLVGIPGDTPPALDRTLDVLVAAGVPHLSLYPFALRRATALSREPSSQAEAARTRPGRLALFTRCADRLVSRGYVPLSLTHFGLRASDECLHHVESWDGANVLGLGASALSFLDGTLVRNVRALDRYLRAPPGGTAEETVRLAPDDVVRRWLLLALTKRGHAVTGRLVDRYGEAAVATLDEALAPLERRGVVERTRDGARLSPFTIGNASAAAMLLGAIRSDAYVSSVSRRRAGAEAEVGP